MGKMRNLSVESLERREVFTGVPGIEGFRMYDVPIRYYDDSAAIVCVTQPDFTVAKVLYSLKSDVEAGEGLPVSTDQLPAKRPAIFF